jgi:anti-sigma-K factor RskA
VKPDHEDLREHAALFVLGALTPEERAEFEAHLAGCSECAAEVRSMSAVPAMLAQAVPQVEPPPALRDRVLRLVASGSSAAEQARSPHVPRHTGVLAPWLAVAASVALTVALGGYAQALRGRIGALETRLRGALARAEAGDRQLADVRRVAADAESRVAVLAAPDLNRIDLAGQPAAPQASGRGYWSRSRGLVFTATSLPALPAGRTYQLWVLPAQGSPISSGWLFRPDAAGRAAALFDTPADLPRPTALAVSIEPDGGVPAPTGALYLVGRLAGT